MVIVHFPNTLWNKFEFPCKILLIGKHFWYACVGSLGMPSKNNPHSIFMLSYGISKRITSSWNNFINYGAKIQTCSLCEACVWHTFMVNSVLASPQGRGIFVSSRSHRWPKKIAENSTTCILLGFKCTDLIFFGRFDAFWAKRRETLCKKYNHALLYFTPILNRRMRKVIL